MEQIMNYIKPELIVVAVVLYFVGVGFKKAEAVPDKYIPLILGGIGIVLCAIWVLATCPLDTGQNIAMAVAVLCKPPSSSTHCGSTNITLRKTNNFFQRCELYAREHLTCHT